VITYKLFVDEPVDRLTFSQIVELNCMDISFSKLIFQWHLYLIRANAENAADRKVHHIYSSR